MDMNNFSFSISYSIDFADIPEGAEEYAEMTRSNIEMVVSSRISDFIGDSIFTIDDAAVQSMINTIAQTEIAFEFSAAQSEKEQKWYERLSGGCYVTVTMSQSGPELKEIITEAVTTQIQSSLGGV